MKTIFVAGVLILCIGVACSERAFPQRSLAARAAALSADVSQPYWFLGASRKGGSSIQAIQVPVSAGDFAYDSDNDDDDENNNGQQAVFSLYQDDDDDSDDDQANEQNVENDDDDSEMTGNIIGILSLDEEREVGNYENDDDAEESGMETAIILPRSALKNIPDGSVVAVVDDSESTGRAVRRYYYRRRRGGGGGKRRRRGGNRRRRRGGYRRRRRPSIRVIRPSGTRGNRVSNRRRGSNVIRL